MTLGVPPSHIRPRIYFILNTSSETKAVNGTVVDILERRKRLLKGCKMPSLENGHVPLIDNPLTEIKHEEQIWSDNIPKYKKFKPDYNNYLPIFNMEIADKGINATELEGIITTPNENDNTEQKSQDDLHNYTILAEQLQGEKDNNAPYDKIPEDSKENNINKDINGGSGNKVITGTTTIIEKESEKIDGLNDDITINIVIYRKALLLEGGMTISTRLTKDGMGVRQEPMTDNTNHIKESSPLEETIHLNKTDTKISTSSVVKLTKDKRSNNAKKKSAKLLQSKIIEATEKEPQESADGELAIGKRTTLDLYGTGKLRTSTFVYNKGVPYNDIYKVRSRCEGPPSIRSHTIIGRAFRHMPICP